VSGDGVAVRAYSAVTRLYPRVFRDEYRADMVLLFREQCRDESKWRVLPRAAVDLAITIPVQHLEQRMHRAPSRAVPLTYFAIAAAGLVLAVVGGANVTAVMIGLVVALGAGATAVVAWRRSAPVHETTLSANWWKYLSVGPSLIALVIIAAGIGVEAWFLGIAFVVAAFVFSAIGLVLGLTHLFNRRTRGLPT
jgi:hypothetical protein